MTFRAYVPSRVAGRISGTWGGVALAMAGHAAVAVAIALGGILLPPQTDFRVSDAIFVEIVRMPAAATAPPSASPPATTVKPLALAAKYPVLDTAPLPVPEPEARFSPPKPVEPPPLTIDESPAVQDTAAFEMLEPAPTKPARPEPASTDTSSAARLEAPALPAVAEVSNGSTGATGKAPDRTEPYYAHNPKPAYPVEARRRRQEGRVLLLVDVSAGGRASDVAVRVSSGYRLLDKAAVKAVRQWTFRPATRNGAAVPSTVEVPVRFFLD